MFTDNKIIKRNRSYFLWQGPENGHNNVSRLKSEIWSTNLVSWNAKKICKTFLRLFLLHQKRMKKYLSSNLSHYFNYSMSRFFFLFPICITCYPPLRTINFGKYLRLFQIKPIKTVEFRFMQIGKKKAKTWHTVENTV